MHFGGDHGKAGGAAGEGQGTDGEPVNVGAGADGRSGGCAYINKFLQRGCNEES